jgi:DNA-binding HxlR family transcriptional regulator
MFYNSLAICKYKCKENYLHNASNFNYFCSVKKKAPVSRSNCPISMTLDILGDKWSLLIVRDMIFKGKRTYGEFLNSDEKIATNILADKLAMLEAGGIISKQEHPESKAKVLYTLTKKGIDLIPALVEIVIWSERYHDVHPNAAQFVKMVKKDKEGTIQGLRNSLKGR